MHLRNVLGTLAYNVAADRVTYPLMGTEVPPQQLAFFATQHGVSLNWFEQHFSK